MLAANGRTHFEAFRSRPFRFAIKIHLMLPFSESQDPKKAIHLSADQAEKMVAVYKHFSTAIRPPDLPAPAPGVLEDPAVKYMTTFSFWARQLPRYHPAFNDPATIQADVEFVGFNFWPPAMEDPKLLRKASKYVWYHRTEVPSPHKLKAWMADQIDLEDQPLTDEPSSFPTSIFQDFETWNRYHQFILDQKRSGRDNFDIVAALTEENKSGRLDLPPVILDNCEYFLAMAATATDLKDVHANQYVDLAKPQIDETARPDISLKKSVGRKKISKRQLAELEDIVVYLLPASLRVGLKGKLLPSQLEYLAKAAKWLRPRDHAIWQKQWTDGLDILALMVMDRDDPLMADAVKPIARSIEAQIDDIPEPDLLEHKQVLELRPAKPRSPDPDRERIQFRQILLVPNIKTIPGSDEPKDIVLARMGILRPDGIDEDRLQKMEEVFDATYARRDDPNFWLMNRLHMTCLLMDQAIDLDGNILADQLEVTPLLRKELREGPERVLWNQIAGLWLYPEQKKNLPEYVSKYEAEMLQTVCAWLDNDPRRPRPFFWRIQDMTYDQFRGSPPFNGDRMRQLARFIHAHRDDPPDFERLAALK